MSNSTAPQQFYSWRPEPLVRGTFSILSTCLLTLFLCVWTAVHLNIPEHNKQNAQTWRKIGWLILATFAPELVAITAYCQSKDADEIETFMRDALSQTTPLKWWQKIFIKKSALNTMRWWRSDLRRKDTFLDESNAQKSQQVKEGVRERSREDHLAEISDTGDPEQSPPHRWTRTHSLYAAMGGFAIDYSKTNPPCFPGGLTRLTLKPRGLRLLSKHALDAIPLLSESEICDKSKGDMFTKSLACIQTAWFCTVCLTRWRTGLSVSLLELNTAAHALCTLLTYITFWWNKPLDVQEPTLIPADAIPSLSALLGLLYHRPLLYVYVPGDHGMLPEVQPDEGGNLTVKSGQTALGMGYWRPLGEPDNPDLVIPPAEVHYWRLAQQIPGGLQNLGLGHNLGDAVTRRIKNLPSRDRYNPTYEDLTALQLTYRAPFTVGLVLAGLFYGGIHLLAWSHDFRQPVEGLYWRLSGLVVASSGVCFLLMIIPLAALYDLKKYIHRKTKIMQSSFEKDAQRKYVHLERSLRWITRLILILRLVGMCLFVLGGLLYIFCRVYIVVECILDLTHLPESAFQTPKWSRYIPHFGS